MVIKAKMDASVYKPIYSTEECVVCLDKVPQVILYPCFHHVLCLKCAKKIEQCPICRNSSVIYYPF